MRIFASITAVLLFLFLLTSAPAFSQEGGPDHPQDEKSRDKDAKSKDKDNAGRQDENRRDESRPNERQQDNREHSEATRPQEQTQPEDRRDEHASRPQKQTRPEGQARPEDRRDDRRVEGNGGRPVQGQRGQRIPEEKFRASFGREHHFHVERAHIVNQAQPEFVYSGYTFELTDPWPAEWSYDDDCYIDYVDDNYYLYDVYHPGIRILVFVIG
jgi:hypothetical protein